jgi:hypothetical protein
MIYPEDTVRVTALIPAVLLLTVALSPIGCNGGPPAPSASSEAAKREQMAEIRAEIEQIPLPSKTRYMAVHSLSIWENPYLTVQGSMVTLHVTLADANSSNLGVGGMLRPVGARRQDLNVRTADLPAAMNAVPQTAWPYGRVVAIEEAHDAPASARPELRRNMETAIKTLGDLGIVVYEWQDNPALR